MSDAIQNQVLGFTGFTLEMLFVSYKMALGNSAHLCPRETLENFPFAICEQPLPKFSLEI